MGGKGGRSLGRRGGTESWGVEREGDIKPGEEEGKAKESLGEGDRSGGCGGAWRGRGVDRQPGEGE